VIASAEDFHVRAASQRDFDPNEYISTINDRNGYRLYLQMLLAVKHGSHHVAFHYDHLCG
jgi:hypothetical protein